MKERLTIEGLFCNIGLCGGLGIEGPDCGGTCGARQIYEKCRAYEDLGTVEEFRALKEADQATEVIVETEDDREYIDFICPKCREIIKQKRKGQAPDRYEPKYHDSCGQQLAWREEAEKALEGN